MADTRPTKPITIDGIAHEIHIKPVLGEAGPYDLYDIWEVHALMSTGMYTDNMQQDPLRWRHYRQFYQHGRGMYDHFQMASFTFPSDERLIPDWSRLYVTVEGVYDFIDWVQSGEWDKKTPSVGHPSNGDSISPFENGGVICMIHSPTGDQMRAEGKTEEEIYQHFLDQYLASLPPVTN